MKPERCEDCEYSKQYTDLSEMVCVMQLCTLLKSIRYQANGVLDNCPLKKSE